MRVWVVVTMVLIVSGCGPAQVTCETSTPASPCALTVGAKVVEQLDEYREMNWYRVAVPDGRDGVELALEASIDQSTPSRLQVGLTEQKPDGSSGDSVWINDEVRTSATRLRIDSPAGTNVRFRVEFGGMTTAATYTLTVE